MTLKQLCNELSISEATGKNWLKLGKIKPDIISSSEPVFSDKYVEDLKNDIALGKITALSSRRNKKFASGSFFYSSYVPRDSDCLPKVRAITEYLNKSGLSLSLKELCLVLSTYASQLFDSIGMSNNTQPLISDLENAYIPQDYDTGMSSLNAANLDVLLSFKFTYEEGTDTLGLIYMSLKDVSSKKSAGSYYTPKDIVQKSIDNLKISPSLQGAVDNLLVLDPCCGSGNFLIQLPSNMQLSNIYGCDIDPICVCIARINLALKYKAKSIDEIKNNISCRNFLTSNVSDLLETSDRSFDYIIGNPPWGYEFSKEEKALYNKLYTTACAKTVESYDLFTEKSLSFLNIGGRLSFVLPEAALTVNIHKNLRQIIISECNITYLAYLGDVFNKVSCPCVILQLMKTGQKLSTKGMIVDDCITKPKGSKDSPSYVINTSRTVSADTLSFYTNDIEYSILETMTSLKEHTTLKEGATFALGIVTGNNQKYIIEDIPGDTPKDGYEIVLKGSDISKYHISKKKRYILFSPENFQQVANTAIYRAKEKLFYRFISSELTFAYDDEGILSLNSCNILIPEIPGLCIKYILAILNSSPAQFFFKKSFNSVKILRSHLEQIPIPLASLDIQKEISDIVDQLIAIANYVPKYDSDISKKGTSYSHLYDKLDRMIASLYGLTDEQYSHFHDKI